MHISISKVNFTSIGINIAKVDFGRYDSGGEPQLNGLYITPADASAISVTPNEHYNTLLGKYLKYSFNGKKWKDWNGSVTIEPEQKMYLKGEDDYVWNSSTRGKLITSDGYYNVGGDISSLTNFITEVKKYTFSKLFYEDRYIKDASNLILPATTLGPNCYRGMFYGCTSLTTAPELPATTLADYCYQNMFNRCTSLTTAPELPATTLAYYCYYEMFRGCTALAAAPVLPATTLAYSCYSSMFYGCSSLTTAPELPATTLADYCYQSMFQGCTSLTASPELPATTLSPSCYSSMFNGCTALTTVPTLHATSLVYGCYKEMFRGCTALTTAPVLPATTLTSWCYSNMFNRCTSLTTAPELPATNLSQGCYSNMFSGCTSLITAPELPATTLTNDCYSNMFNMCTSLTTAPELPATTLEFGCYSNMFSGCSKLNNIIMLATDISAGDCLLNWVNGVSSTGTFTKSPEMTSLPNGINGIPAGWAVKDYGAVDYPSEYMTLSALGDGEITITIPAALNSTYATSLSYSKDKSTWNETIINDTKQTISIPVTSGDNVYLKGIAKQLGNRNASVNINSTADINASGNTMSLLYGDDYKDKVAFQSGSEFTFRNLFKDNTHLISAESLILPATTLANYCYGSMFNSCTSLTTAPKLHVTTLANNCYDSMFSSCKSLTTAPELPATTLASNCYGNMFADCTSLTTAPALQVTTLTDNCYYRMFAGCTSLITAPALPATILIRGCYAYMFQNCASLTAAPELPATTLADWCYQSMFTGCTSLTTAPALPATTLASGCYHRMFLGCTSLTTAPVLPATELALSCYYGMFYNCSKLNSITMLATDISASNCLISWVQGVASTGTFTKSPEMTSLPTGASGIPSGWTVKDYGAVDYSSEYMTLSALGDGEITITIPAAINSSYATSLSYSKDKSTWNETIIDDTAQTISIHVTNGENVYLKGIAKQLGNNSTGVNINSSADINASGNIMSLLYVDDYKDKVEFPKGSENTFNSLFKDNKHLISAENLILTATTVSTCYFAMFNGCTSLTTAPQLPATTLNYECYSFMFQDCTSLTTAPELHATTLAYGCYFCMFYGCTSLTTAPQLPATTLDGECYKYMFLGCSSLNSITMLATDISAYNCLYNWVSGVSKTGTFTKSPEMTTLPTGPSGIPSGWTVVDYGAA